MSQTIAQNPINDDYEAIKLPLEQVLTRDRHAPYITYQEINEGSEVSLESYYARTQRLNGLIPQAQDIAPTNKEQARYEYRFNTGIPVLNCRTVERIFCEIGYNSKDVEHRLLYSDRYITGLVCIGVLHVLQNEGTVMNGLEDYLMLYATIQRDGSLGHLILRYMCKEYFPQCFRPTCVINMTANGKVCVAYANYKHAAFNTLLERCAVQHHIACMISCFKRIHKWRSIKGTYRTNKDQITKQELSEYRPYMHIASHNEFELNLLTPVEKYIIQSMALKFNYKENGNLSDVEVIKLASYNSILCCSSQNEPISERCEFFDILYDELEHTLTMPCGYRSSVRSDRLYQHGCVLKIIQCAYANLIKNINHVPYACNMCSARYPTLLLSTLCELSHSY